jgi:hypothetical protein
MNKYKKSGYKSNAFLKYSDIFITMGAGGPFPWDKARPRRDADHSAPSSAEVDNT